jgi:ligand-binding sensor domain-containing protein
MLRIGVLGVVCCALLGYYLTAQAQTVKTPWITFTQEDGLISNNVLSILPNEDAIWFGTDVGISRFDGAWESFVSGETMPPGQVAAIANGANGDMVWAGTHSGNIARWDGTEWQLVTTVPGAVQSLVDFGGQLWIGTNRGLILWNGKEQVPIPDLADTPVYALASKANSLLVGAATGLWMYQSQSWSVVTERDGLPGSDVRSIWIDPSGHIWAGTTAGLAWQDSASGKWVEVPTEGSDGKPLTVRSLAGDAQGVVWGGTGDSGALKVTTQGILTVFSGDFSGDQGLTTPYVRAVAVDQDQSVWFGTATGVFRFDESAWTNEWRDDYQYPGINYITALLAEPENSLWIGTRGGLIHKQGIGFKASEQVYTAENTRVEGSSNSGLPGNVVTDLIHDAYGQVWVATPEGVALFDGQTWVQQIPPDYLPSTRVNVLFADDVSIWIGTASGLSRYELDTGILDQIDLFADRNIQSLAVDSLGRLWVGTSQAGIYVQDDGGAWLHYEHDPANANTISGNSVVAMTPDPNISGGMWVAINQQGLIHWDGNRWQTYNSASGLPSNRLYTLYTDPIDSSLWIGSEGGLTHFDGLTWQTLQMQDILPQAPVFAVTRTFEDSYWIGGKAGTVYYHPEQTPPWIRITSTSGLTTQLDSGAYQVESDKEVNISFLAGDLHTGADQLEILYRVSSPGSIGQWRKIDNRLLSLKDFGEIGNYIVEFKARDLAFNYSDIARISFDVVPPPAMINLPLLGEIRQDLFVWMLVLLVTMIGSFSIMGAERIQRHRRTREAISRGYNPFVSGEPVRREDMFFGRHDLLQRIVDTLHNNSIMIHGERRIGKTTLLYQLANRLREVEDPEYWFIPLYIDLEGTTADVFFHFLMEEILNGVMTLPGAGETLKFELQDVLYYQLSSHQYTDREFSRDVRHIIKTLQEYGDVHYSGKYLRLILLMDEMDVMSGYDPLVQQRLRRIFMRDFAATLGAVVAGIRISKEWDRIESPWYNLFNEIELTPFDREQAIELLVAPVEGYYRYDQAAIEFIVEQSEGRPFRLQQYALEAVNHMLAEHRQVITMEDVEVAHNHIQNMGGDHNIGLNDPSISEQKPEPDGQGLSLAQEQA